MKETILKKRANLFIVFVMVLQLICITPISTFASGNVIEVTVRDETTAYTDFNEGWSAAYKATQNAGGGIVTIKLLADLVAPNGEFNFDSGTSAGCLYFDHGSDYYTEGADVYLDLNGHTIDRNLSAPTKYGCVIWHESGKLVVTDSSPEGNGKITGGYSTNDRDSDRIYTCGGGVHLEEETIFILDGGHITGNRTEGCGGGITVGVNSFVSIKGGSVSDNYAGEYGGGIHLAPYSFLSVGGDDRPATVSGNIARYGGGGVYGDCFYGRMDAEETGSTFFLSNDGKIINNVTYGDGGGICWDSYGELSILGEISGNSAPKGYGGGVNLRWYGTKVYLGGKAKIIGNNGYSGNPENTNSNLYLNNHHTNEPKAIINAVGQSNSFSETLIPNTPLEEGAQIGISMNFDHIDGRTACTSSESMFDVDRSDCFTYDGYDYELEWFKDANGYNQFRVVEKQQIDMNHAVASVTESNGTTKYYTDLNRAWSDAVLKGVTAGTVLKLCRDWYAPFGGHYLGHYYDSVVEFDLQGFDFEDTLISVGAGTFTLKDSVGGGKITGADGSSTKGAVTGCEDANLHIEGVEISGNNGPVAGGVYWDSTGVLSIVDAKIINNTADAGGGGGVYTTLIDEINNIYLGGTTIIQNNTAGGIPSNFNLYCLDEDDDWVDDEGRRINNAAGQVVGVPNRPLTGDALIGISICGFPGTNEDNTNNETLLISGDNNKFDYRDFTRFFGDYSPYTVRAAFNPETMENNPWNFYHNTWWHEEARYPKLTSVAVKSDELLTDATIDENKQIITLTAKANKKKSFENMTLDYLISYGTNNDLTSVPGHDIARNIFEDNGYLLLSNNNTYLTCTVNIVPEGGVWADEQDPAISPYAMSITANGSTVNYDSAEQGWAYALKQSLTYPVTITLLADWNAPAGFYGLDENNEEYGTYHGCLYLDYNYTDLTIDLNGYSINRGLTSATDWGHVLYCNDGDVTLTIKDSVGGGKITGGYSNGDGGGIYMYRGNLILEGGEISGNRCTGLGGGIYWDSNQNLSLVGGKITGNTAGENGGGVYTTKSNNIYLGGQVYIKDNKSANGTDNFYLPDSGYFINHAKGQKTGVPNHPLRDGAKIGIRLPHTKDIQSGTTLISGEDSRFDSGNFGYFEGDDSSYFVRAQLEIVKDDNENDVELHHLYYNTWSHESADYPLILSVEVKEGNGLINEASISENDQVITLKAISPDKSLFKSVVVEDLVKFTVRNDPDTYWRFCDVAYDLRFPTVYKVVSKKTNTYVQCKVIVEFPDCPEHKDENGDHVCDLCELPLGNEFVIQSYNADTKSVSVIIPAAGTYSLIFANYNNHNGLANVEVQEITVTEARVVTKTITKDFGLSAGDKIMLWSDLERCIPKCEAFIVE